MKMKITSIREAKTEARKFIKFCDEFEEKVKQENKYHECECPRERGLVRAQSMILTRALSSMRKGE